MDSIPMIIAKIDYDFFGMPKRIQFTNGHVTEQGKIGSGEHLGTTESVNYHSFFTDRTPTWSNNYLKPYSTNGRWTYIKRP